VADQPYALAAVDRCSSPFAVGLAVSLAVNHTVLRDHRLDEPLGTLPSAKIHQHLVFVCARLLVVALIGIWVTFNLLRVRTA
jgi:hypothetical protein